MNAHNGMETFVLVLKPGSFLILYISQFWLFVVKYIETVDSSRHAKASEDCSHNTLGQFVKGRWQRRYISRIVRSHHSPKPVLRAYDAAEALLRGYSP
ncbi:hypothetical protein EJ08DRAFT_5602 [Tothia fuscella]|uniref:Uncharacterized protein n=1 Tax=Tothia fuscella TaxID=1048955 RepID=A0A9P4P260_9PEZI|nr:hypothetical protein EJ08DRAFT_5602 [Tothia fuscella]